jgi:hypothetical protein
MQNSTNGWIRLALAAMAALTVIRFASDASAGRLRWD